MSNQITIEEVKQLPFVQLDQFNPDYDDKAFFTIHTAKFEVAASIAFDEVSNRIYGLPVELSPIQRMIVLQAIDILIDEHFAEEPTFTNNEDVTRLYFAQHSMCANYGLCTDQGRVLRSFEEI
ncbi:hypothetical protein [Acinetobacter brisouii]|uniref:hypothetical protein n=1 Tax=Acinetobacter brisouii TaxID=396323 RepID=UPI00124DF91B|nr:hypothetical protein [Acinetobacter brisouii]